MFFKHLQKVLKDNIREYGMYIALFVIMVIFTITTDGIFISSRNISNLLNQTGYIAVLAVGMTLSSSSGTSTCRSASWPAFWARLRRSRWNSGACRSGS